MNPLNQRLEAVRDNSQVRTNIKPLKGLKVLHNATEKSAQSIIVTAGASWSWKQT